MNETGEEGVGREVWEETGLKVEKATYQFSLPNIYIYSGFSGDRSGIQTATRGSTNIAVAMSRKKK